MPTGPCQKCNPLLVQNWRTEPVRAIGLPGDLKACGTRPVKEIAHVSKTLVRPWLDCALQRTMVDLPLPPGYWVALILVLFQAQTCKVSSGKLESWGSVMSDSP